MDPKVQISGKQLTKNWGWNLSGLGLPLFAALAAMPFIVKGLGPARFGVLSIVWAVLGSLTLFDLGMGRSTTKFVAECLGRGDTQVLPRIFWASLWSQILIGLVGTLLATPLVPLLVDHFLHLSATISGETKSSFLILAVSIPVVLAANSLRGVLEAAQRFDVVNYVKIPAATFIYLLPAMALPFGLKLPAIVLLLALSRLGTALVFLAVCLRLFPSVRGDCTLDFQLLRPLLSYGGWVSISNFVAPLLAYTDRFVVGSVLGMSYVSYYTAPQEAITKGSVLPGTLLTTLFPALATLEASGDHERVQQLCLRAIKSLLLLMTPALLIIAVFARQLLNLWLGADFAARSTGVLQIFCAGLLINSLAFVPFFLLQGLGRPDVTGKIHLLELPIYALALAILLPRLGLTGAALAYAFRLFLDACLLFGAASRLKLLSIRAIFDTSVRRASLLLCGLGTVLVVACLITGILTTQILFVGIALFAFVAAVWKYVFDAKEKNIFLAASLQIRAVVGRSK